MCKFILIEYKVALVRGLEDVHITGLPCMEAVFECELSRPVSANAVQWTMTSPWQTTPQIITPSEHHKLDLDDSRKICRLILCDLKADDSATYTFSACKVSSSANLAVDCMLNSEYNNEIRTS